MDTDVGTARLHLPLLPEESEGASPMVLAGSALWNHLSEDLLTDLQWPSTAPRESRTNLILHSKPSTTHT